MIHHVERLGKTLQDVNVPPIGTVIGAGRNPSMKIAAIIDLE